MLSAGAWSIPVVAAAVAVPLHAASAAAGAIDASGVVWNFPDATGANTSGSSELVLTGQVAFSTPTTSDTDVTATFTWQGTGANAGSDGIWVYSGDNGGLDGWTFVQGAPDNGLHAIVSFQTSVVAGTAQVPVVSRYDGLTTKAIMYGEETPVGGNAEYDGVYTIRFSAPGYTDGVLTVPYTRPPVD
ncbi:hypothetical protein GCM10010489_32340 [Microbacterium saperdae]|nr:hypothetical protein GCM10010489_32340 [Microbacterium saperdae]